MGRYRDEIAAPAAPLRDAGDFDVLLDRIGPARVVMLGEASHGTHEFYRWRAALTQRLIDERGFSFVAVEGGDWPDCERVDRSVRGDRDAPDDPRAALLAFDRWPTWMWDNDEVVDFCRWPRARNLRLEESQRVGLHGLDAGITVIDRRGAGRQRSWVGRGRSRRAVGRSWAMPRRCG